MEALRRIKASTVEKRLLDEKGEPNFGISFYVLNAKGEYAGVAIENVLSSVPVVHVPVHDEDFLCQARAYRHTGGERHMIKQAKPHRPVPRRVMTRGTDGTESGLERTVHHRSDSGER